MPDPTTDVRVHPLVLLDAERIWHMKTERCKDVDHWDMSPQITFIKDDEVVATLFGQGGRNEALACIKIGAQPIQADISIVHLDAHSTSSLINPATGEKWKEGEMQKACDNDDACATGVLTDCIMTMAVFQDGHIESIERKYTGHEKAGQMIWQEPIHMVEDGKDLRMEGIIADEMRVAVDKTSPGSDFASHLTGLAKTFDVPVEHAYWHSVSLATKCMAGIGAISAAMLAPPNQKTRDIVDDEISPESMENFMKGDMGLVLALLRGKWGLGR